MKYYVYAGYYENFISGHKLPKPYTLRDEFKTFDEALDYVLENWEDDAIFFTEDVIGDAIDNGFINDEDWENYLMEESKNSTRKSIKESINYEVEGLYFFNFDVGETCSIDLKDAFNADGVISEFYKNENRIYSIVVCSAIDYCFFISYDYRKKKVIYSECFSYYKNAKNKMREKIKNI